MKICRKCGARQRDSRLYCVDCGTRLGRRLTAEEEAQEQENLDQTMEKLYNRRDPLFVSLLDRICGWIDLAGFVVLLVLLVLAGAGVFPAGKPSSDAVAVVFIGAFFFLIGAGGVFSSRDLGDRTIPDELLDQRRGGRRTVRLLFCRPASDRPPVGRGGSDGHCASALRTLADARAGSGCGRAFQTDDGIPQSGWADSLTVPFFHALSRFSH